MEDLLRFMADYGFIVSAIAIVGVVLLGILKYCNVFGKLAEAKRHYLYLLITVGASILATTIYLLIVGQFDAKYMLAVSLVICALNQTFYNIFKITPVCKLVKKAIDAVVAYIKVKRNKPDDTE